MARAATSPELTLFRTPGQWSRLRAAILAPATIYTARINQSFSSTDNVLEITYDGGGGTLADVLPDMTLLVGSSAGAHDVGIVRIRAADSTKFYIGRTSHVAFADNQYLTVLRDFGLWARHVLIDEDSVPYLDGAVAYSDQHEDFDPVPIMGSHRVLKLTGAEVATNYDFSGSYVFDSTITGYAVSAPGASSTAGMTTATPTIAWNATGWYPVYLTVTAETGKSFFGVRWVYVWSDDDPPASAAIEECRGEAEAGGWQFRITLFDNVDLATVRDRALVILFAEDYYGATAQSIGPLAGSENIVAVGWIGGEESINWHPDQGQVSFSCQGAHYWFGKIPAFPDGVEFVTAAPTAWTEMQNLTVDRGVWHFLHWRSTATRIMDVHLTGDTRYAPEVSSLGANLWEQLRELAFMRIFARPGVDRYGRLFVEIHPQLVPVADRDWPTVMTITKADWEGEIAFDRITTPPIALVNLSGVAINASGVGTPYFSLSPGHAYSPYGALEMVDNLWLSSQAQANTLAGLYRAWQNNPYPSIPVVLSANNRLIDCFPQQQCAITIAAGDTPRGISYSGNLIPTSVAYVHDPETGYLHTEVTFEAQTVADLAIDGDIPGSRVDVTIPPPAGFPPLPDFPITLPGSPEPSPTGPVRVLLHDREIGLVYTENFDDASPTWRTINAGLTQVQYQGITNIEICPNGAVYVGRIQQTESQNFLARAAFPGATFAIQSLPNYVNAMTINPLVSEQVGVLTGSFGATHTFHLGAAGSYTQPGVTFTFAYTAPHRFTYGLGKWLLTGYDQYVRIKADGTAVDAAGTPPIERSHFRAGTTGKTFHNIQSSYNIRVGETNLTTSNVITLSSPGVKFDDSGTFAPMICADVDPSGMYLMARGGPGANKTRSSDGGATWLLMAALPVGDWYFRCYSAQRWIAAHGTVRYTEDFGDSWDNKTGNLTSLYTFPEVDIIKVFR